MRCPDPGPRARLRAQSDRHAGHAVPGSLASRRSRGAAWRCGARDGAIPRPGHELRVRGLRRAGRTPRSRTPTSPPPSPPSRPSAGPTRRRSRQMALENYLEMRDRVDDADFLLQRALERELAERHPGRFVPRYAMVTFLRVPYATAFERGQVQRELLVEATRGRDSSRHRLGLARRQVDTPAAPRRRIVSRRTPMPRLTHPHSASTMPASFLFYDLETFGADPRSRGSRSSRRSAPMPTQPDRGADQLLRAARRRPAALAGRDADHRHHAAAGVARRRERGRGLRAHLRRDVAAGNLHARLQLAALRRRVHPPRPVPQFPRCLRARVARRQLPLGPARRDAPGACVAAGRHRVAAARGRRDLVPARTPGRRQRRAHRRRARSAVRRARADRPGAQAAMRRNHACGTTR